MEGPVCDQLKRNIESHAFDGKMTYCTVYTWIRLLFDRKYSHALTQKCVGTLLHVYTGYHVQWEEESTTVSCLHTLNESSLGHEYHCTDISWNCTGSVVGVAFGRFDHSDWCSHKASIKLYVVCGPSI